MEHGKPDPFENITITARDLMCALGDLVLSVLQYGPRHPLSQYDGAFLDDPLASPIEPVTNWVKDE